MKIRGKRASFLLLISSLMMTLLPVQIGTGSGSANAASSGSNPVLRSDNQKISTNYYTNLNDKVSQLKELDEGTIIVRFRYTGNSPIMSLFSLSNNTLTDGHFHLYVSPTAIGSENRYVDASQKKVNTHVKSDTINLTANEVHTVAMVMSKAEGYKYFLDGKLVKQDTTSPRVFLNSINNPNSAQLGRTERSAGANSYTFAGDIDYAEVYNVPLDNETLINTTGQTNPVPVINPMPSGAKITEPQNIFYSGFMSSNNYRIPALLETKKGTLIAGIDRRVPHGGDSPNNIDAMIRRSFDQGDTWEKNGIIINDYPDTASNIDLELLQDQSNGRVFALVDAFPNGAGLMGGFGNNAYKGTGFKTINGKKYMFLNDNTGKEYTIRENGKVYDAAGALTNYTVDVKRNLYQNGVKINNIFSATSPLKPYKTSYLELYYSDDEGATWTGPIDLNDQTKEEWMIFLGTGPGSGIQMTQGEHAGRLVFPVYFLNDNNKQASAVIYSDDHGVTWHRGESPNEGRDVGNGTTIHEKTFNSSTYEITESQVVEMPDGQLKLFMRNYSGYAQIATSFDGGQTWDSNVVTEKDLVAAYSQMTAIRYNGQIDEKEAVIFASPANSSSRINGTVKVGLIDTDGTYANGRTKYKFNWKYSQRVKEGTFAYSSLANLSNGEIGLLYEGTANTDMSFIKFNTDYLKWQREGEKPAPVLQSLALETPQPATYVPGDKVRIKAVFDHYVMLMGDKRLTGTIGNTSVTFPLVNQNSAGTEFVFEGVFPELPKGTHTLAAQLDSDLSIYNVYGNQLTMAGNVTGSLSSQDAISQPVVHYAEPRSFNGSSDYVSLSDQLAAVKDLNQGTLYAEFKLTDGGNARSIVSLSNSAVDASNLTIAVNGGKLHVEARESKSYTSNGTYILNYTSPNGKLYNDGQWHKVAVSVDEVSTVIYVDGEKLTTATGFNFASAIPGLNTFLIGANRDFKASPEWYYKGDLSQVGVYNVKLKDTELGQLTSIL